MGSTSGSIYFVGDPSTRDVLLGACASLRLRLVSFSSFDEFITNAPALDLGCLVADTDSLQVPGSTILKTLDTIGVSFPVILIGDHIGSNSQSWPHLTIVAFLQKPLAVDALIEPLRKARQLLSTPNASVPDPEAVSRLGLLTKEERDVLSGIVAGMTNKAIASSLRIDIRAVELCRIEIMETLGVKSLSRLVRVALAGGMKILR